MSESKTLIITPKTRVGELLDVYPQLEPVLYEIAPAFKKLKNPVLRRTIGKVATLQQAATVGNVPVTEIINTLRMEVGQELFNETSNPGSINTQEPEWFREDKVTIRFDASQIIDAGQNPMQEIFNQLDLTEPGSIFQLSTPFVPAPIIELIEKKGYAHYCRQSEQELWSSYFFKSTPK